jgi:hypothetical protein
VLDLRLGHDGPGTILVVFQLHDDPRSVVLALPGNAQFDVDGLLKGETMRGESRGWRHEVDRTRRGRKQSLRFDRAHLLESDVCVSLECAPRNGEIGSRYDELSSLPTDGRLRLLVGDEAFVGRGRPGAPRTDQRRRAEPSKSTKNHLPRVADPSV